MGYRETRKAWSINANAAQERARAGVCHEYPVEIDHYIKITIERKQTGEKAIFECFEGTRIDNYTVYCNDNRLGVFGITELMARIRKALPRFRNFN